MNIQTATGYARHGYRIYRDAWKDNSGLGIVPSEPGELLYMTIHGECFILTPEDCIANDWRIIT